MDGKIWIVYHSEFSSTGQIARQINEWLQEFGFSTAIHHHKEITATEDYSAIIAGCLIYGGAMDKQFLSFVSQHAQTWNQLPGMFFPVSLTKAGTDDRELQELLKIRESIAAKTGWQPEISIDVAGTYWYRKYIFFMRRVLRRISQKSGWSTDTSRNHEYTDWATLRMEVKAFCERINA
jgi:menaquinone-dependent protoporphyrinogen oxidase